MKKILFFSALLAGVLFLAFCKKDTVSEIVVPAGSVDALQKAVNDAPECGTIRLAAGTHTETGTVTITKRLKLTGDVGAILQVDTKPTTDNVNPLIPAILVSKVASTCDDDKGVCIENIEFRAKEAEGGTGIFIEQSNSTCIRKCKILRHQYAVVIAGSDYVEIEGNTLVGLDSWPNFTYEFHGIMVITGKHMLIKDNTISRFVSGSWIGDEFGTYTGNTTGECYIGVIPCAIPVEAGVKPRANVAPVYTMIPGKSWNIINNTFNDNLFFGVALEDGANECLVKDNDIKNSGLYDISLGQQWAPNDPNNLFATTWPLGVSRFNKVDSKLFPNVRIKDCGSHNTVEGGILVPDSERCY